MNIILIGFMASGKSTVGSELAEREGMSFIDTDKLIEDNASMSIKDIFQCYGESRFRELEREAIRSLASADTAVISVGGGAVMNPDNFSFLKSIGFTVFLNMPLSRIFKNLENSFRPLIGNKIDEEKVAVLYSSRLDTYLQADYVVDVGNKDIEETIEEISSIMKVM